MTGLPHQSRRSEPTASSTRSTFPEGFRARSDWRAKTPMSVRRDTIPHQNPVDEIGLEHPVLPPVPARVNGSVALRVQGLPRNAFNLVEAHSLSNACRRSSLPLSNVDRNTVEVIHLDRSRTRGSPVRARSHLPIGRR